MAIGRRTFLRATGGVVLGSSLAGCNVLSDPARTTVYLDITANERTAVTVTMLDPDIDDRRDAVVFFEQIELEGETLEEGFSEAYERAFESKRVVVELESIHNVRQFEYFPNCPEDERGDVLDIHYRVDTDQLEYTGGCATE